MKKNKAFTLIELLVVIAIIGILTTILTFTFIEAQKKSRDTKRKADLKTLQVSFEAYKTQQGKYPVQCAIDLNHGTLGALSLGYQKIDDDSFGCINAVESGNPTPKDLLVKGYIQSVPLDPNHTAYVAGETPRGYYLHSDGKNYKIISYLPELIDSSMNASECKNVAEEYYDPSAGFECTDYQVSSNSEVTKTW